LEYKDFNILGPTKFKSLSRGNQALAYFSPLLTFFPPLWPINRERLFSFIQGNLTPFNSLLEKSFFTLSLGPLLALFFWVLLPPVALFFFCTEMAPRDGFFYSGRCPFRSGRWCSPDSLFVSARTFLMAFQPIFSLSSSDGAFFGSGSWAICAFRRLFFFPLNRSLFRAFGAPVHARPVHRCGPFFRGALPTEVFFHFLSGSLSSGGNLEK